MQTEETTASDTIDALIAVLQDASKNQQLIIVGAVIETLRLVAAAVPADKKTAAMQATIKTLTALSALPIESANFSLLRAVKSPKYDSLFARFGEHDDREVRARSGLNAIKIFMNVLELDPSAATPELVETLLTEEAANFPEPQPAVAVEAPTTKFELNQPSTVLRVFKPKPFVYSDNDPQLVLVHYKGELPGGGLGPSLWGVCYNDEDMNTAHVLLETGEYVTTPMHSLLLASATTPSDVPPYLMACAYLFVPLLLSKFNKLADTAEAFKQLQARFGEFTAPLYFHQIEAQNVSSLTGVIESAKWQFGGTAPFGATAKFFIPELASSGGYAMVVAESAAVRPYVYANLVAKSGGSEKILMRIDRPREFSALGVYLFPMKDHAVALVVPPTI